MMDVNALPKNSPGIVFVNVEPGNHSSRVQGCFLSICTSGNDIANHVIVIRNLSFLSCWNTCEPPCGEPRSGPATRESVWLQERTRGPSIWCFQPGSLTKYQEQNVNLYITFINLTNASATVSREGLCKAMKKYGCPEKFIIIVLLCSITAYLRVSLKAARCLTRSQSSAECTESSKVACWRQQYSS